MTSPHSLRVNLDGLVILIGIGLGIVVFRTFLRLRKEKRLRDNYPQRKVIEITLPKGTKDARFITAGFWAKVASSTSADPKARRQGVGQIDFKYIAAKPESGGTPRLKVVICADADRMDAVKRAAKTVFEDAMVVELEHDPLAPFVAHFQDVEGVEPEQVTPEGS